MVKNKIIIITMILVLLAVLLLNGMGIVSFLEYIINRVTENWIPIIIAFIAIWVIRNRVQDEQV